LIERLVRPAARRRRAWRARRAAAVCAGLSAAGLLAGLAGSAGAARLVDVRVGRHADFVRVVFETDAPAAFSVEPGEAPGERWVRIEAGPGPRAVRMPPGAGVEVTLEPLPDGATLARIRTEAPVRVESQVLDRPPRIVFDLRAGAAAPEAAESDEAPLASEAARAGEEVPAVELEPAPELEPEPELVAGPGEPGAPLLAPELREPSIFPDLAPLAEGPPAGEEPWLAEPLPSAAGEPAPEPPPVSAAPPAAVVRQLDDRSLLVGAAGGLALGLGFGLLARERRRGRAGPRRAGAEPGPEPVAGAPTVVPVAAPAPEEAPARAPVVAAVSAEAPAAARADSAGAGELGLDLLAMLQRLDERFARLEESVSHLLDRTQQLELRGGMQSEELATQRVALARLRLAIARPAGRGSERGPDPEAPAAPPQRPLRES
jgi:hypothetical protein